MIINLLKRNRFRKADMKESSETLCNPGCGWYHVYTYDISRPEESMWIACEKEELAMLRIDIGSAREAELSEYELAYIRDILDFFHKNQKEIILRFTYDTSGNGRIREPAASSIIFRHMEQLGEVIKKYRNDILAVQGILVGNWGEMHGSKYLSDKWLVLLVRKMFESMDHSCYLAVRTPDQWRKIIKHAKAEEKDIWKRKLTLFNDGMFGSVSDLGTYGPSEEDRKKELKWQKTQMAGRPTGGEAVAVDSVIRTSDAVKDMRQMHLGYLNSVYHEKVLQFWKSEEINWKECRKSVSGYQYIGAHLGYRFVVRDVLEKGKGELQISVENTGFGELCEEAECRLSVLDQRHQEKSILTEQDARDWTSGEAVRFYVKLDAEWIVPGNKVYLQLLRKKDGRPIHFANAGAEQEEKILLGRF